MASELLPSEGSLTCGGGLAAEPLHIREIPYSNSAAKFWSSLISEIFNRYPRITSIILQTVSSTRLTRRMLFPSAITEADLGELLTGDSALQMADTLAALEMYGPHPG